ncbi:tail fiber domain-containing protein [Cupriavidus taiwanensis]|uniref:tail fiber domain-containing protein n=1 Tax=Cupriavidus taiwanensis TaxID=164546 RepID=UPI000E142481|nr:tail fiber domain-containing protein [Cupriavidus taiwanensis]SPA17265.1 conserved hypothetical protein [Cupriavidus taiwanensis]
MAANLLKPELTDDYAAVLQEIRDNYSAGSQWFALGDPLNLVAGVIRWNDGQSRIEKWSGTAWVQLAARYGIDVQSLQGLVPGNASGQIPISNGTLCTNLNAEKLGGQSSAYYGTAAAVSAADAKAQSALDMANSASANVSSKVAKAGDTMTGSLTLSGSGTLSAAFIMKAGTYAPHIRSNSAVPGIEWVNGANTAVVMTLSDTGVLTVPAMIQANFVKGVAPSGSSGVFWSTADIGNSWSAWNTNAVYAVQVDAPNVAAGYGGIRWTRWGDSHFAAINAIQGAAGTGAAQITFHVGATQNAWSFTSTAISRGAGGSVYGTWNLNINALVESMTTSKMKVGWNATGAAGTQNYSLSVDNTNNRHVFVSEDNRVMSPWLVGNQYLRVFVDSVAYSIALNPSDAGLKANEAPASEDALALVNALSIVQFDWNEESLQPGVHEPFGLIAQDAKQIAPALFDLVGAEPRAKVFNAAGEEMPPATGKPTYAQDLQATVNMSLRAIQQLSQQLTAARAELNVLKGART